MAQRAPILFPRKIKDKRYFLDNKEYESGIHGFAGIMIMLSLFRISKNIAFLFEDNEETRKVYPYKFRLYSVLSSAESS